MARSGVGIRKLSKDYTLTVRIHQEREWVLRRWVAVKLLRAAAWVLNCGIEVIHA